MLATDDCKIRILDEVNCVLVNLQPKHIKYFEEQYAKFAPNHFFNPKVKLGSWDGRIKFFHNTGKTYTYLLDEIVPKLVAFGYKIKIDDQRYTPQLKSRQIDKNHFSHIIDPETDEPFQLRPYQVDGVNAAIEYGGGVVLAATGAGKTAMTAALVDVYAQCNPQVKTIIIVPSQDLVMQTRNDLLGWGLDTGEYSGDTKDLDHTHVVSTWQALQNNGTIMKQFHLVVVDECHGIRGQILQKLLNENGSHIVHRFGLTGTLPKPETDRMSVHISVGPVRYNITAAMLIDQGWLAKLDIDVVQLEEDLKDKYNRYLAENKNNPAAQKVTYIQFKDQYFGEYSAEKSYLQTHKPRLEYIATILLKKQDEHKGNVFCLVDGVAFGKKLAKLVPGSTFVYGQDKKKARKEVYDLFKTNDNLVVIATVQIASTGLNIKRIFNLVFVDMGKSFIRVIQTIGRGLRKAPDKDYVLVTDISSDLKYGKKHVRERMNFYAEAQYPHAKRKVEYNKAQLTNLFE